jgi:hypothetical protein
MAEQAQEAIAQAQAWARRQFADQEMLQAGVDDAVRTARESIDEARATLVEIERASALLKQEWDEIRTAQSELVKEAADAAKAAKGAARAAQASSVAAQRDAARASRATADVTDEDDFGPDDAWPKLFDGPEKPWDESPSHAEAGDNGAPEDELLFPVVPDEDGTSEERWGGGRILGRFGLGRAED